MLENSILTYAKNATELSRGKKHGSMDIGMSVISTKAMRRRMDIDADASIVHLKVRLESTAQTWSAKWNAYNIYFPFESKPSLSLSQAMTAVLSFSDHRVEYFGLLDLSCEMFHDLYC